MKLHGAFEWIIWFFCDDWHEIGGDIDSIGQICLLLTGNLVTNVRPYGSWMLAAVFTTVPKLSLYMFSVKCLLHSSETVKARFTKNNIYDVDLLCHDCCVGYYSIILSFVLLYVIPLVSHMHVYHNGLYPANWLIWFVLTLCAVVSTMRRISVSAHIAIITANTTCWHNAGLMLARRRRRWANISPALC